MKFLKFVLSIIVMTITYGAHAQFELKAGPIGLLFDSPDISGEYLINQDIGIQATLGLDYGDFNLNYDQSSKVGVAARLQAKFYFKPKIKADGFYAGLYAGPEFLSVEYTDWDVLGNNQVNEEKGTIFSAGMLIGYKWLGKRNILFEMAGGAGRNYGELANDVINTGQYDFMWLIAIGYRFNKKNNE